MKAITTSLITFILSLLTSFLSAQTVGDQGALKLDGYGAKLIVYDTVFANMASGSWGAVVKFDSLSNNSNTYQRIMYKEGVLELFYSKTYNRFESEIVINGIRYEVTTDSATFPIEEGVWYYLFATYDGDVLKLYANGNLVDENNTPNGYIDNNSGDWGIGGRVGYNTWTFKGEIDEAFLIKAVVDSATIAEFECNAFDTASAYNSNIVSYYQFNYVDDYTSTDSWYDIPANFDNNAEWVSGGVRDDKLILEFDGQQLIPNVDGDEYAWYRNGTKISGENGNTLTITENGSYSLLLVKGNCMYYSDTLNIISNGIDEDLFSNKTSVYPNPSEGNLTVSFSEELKEGQLTIYSITGNIIYNKTFNNTKNIYIDGLNEKGIFILTVSAGNKTIHHQKLILN